MSRNLLQVSALTLPPVDIPDMPLSAGDSSALLDVRVTFGTMANSVRETVLPRLGKLLAEGQALADRMDDLTQDAQQRAIRTFRDAARPVVDNIISGLESQVADAVRRAGQVGSEPRAVDAALGFPREFVDAARMLEALPPTVWPLAVDRARRANFSAHIAAALFGARELTDAAIRTDVIGACLTHYRPAQDAARAYVRLAYQWLQVVRVAADAVMAVPYPAPNYDALQHHQEDAENVIGALFTRKDA